jgi:hypothetical protein
VLLDVIVEHYCMCSDVSIGVYSKAKMSIAMLVSGRAMG